MKWVIILTPVILNATLALNGSNSFVLCLGLLIWMVTWWIFEILPLGITALLPIVYLPIFDILPLNQVTANYSNSVIYLFLGGFILARALEKTKLNERLALYILSITGKSDRGIIVGFMISTAFLSMWISNTATTVMMLPIALSVLLFLERQFSDQNINLKGFQLALFLSIAYAANIGGISTPVGTPPNVVLLGFLNDLHNIEVDFWKWTAITFPIAALILFFQYLLLSKLFKYDVPVDKDFRSFVRQKVLQLGRLSSPQVVTLVIFCITCFLWIFKGLIHHIYNHKFLNDTSIAVMASIFLFLTPTSKKHYEPVLSSEDISKLPWNIILLFGGGMALASSLKHVGVIESLTNSISGLEIASPFLLTLLLCTITIFLTEIMSNVALCVVALPVFMQLGIQMGLHPLVIGLPAALCSSMAFSMPISTPPNAIVFGTERIQMKDMLKAGLVLNFIAIGVVMGLGYFLVRLFY